MDRRRETRSTTQESVRVNIGRRTLRCRMRNLSRSGCMIETSLMLVEVGTPLEIVLVPGVVAEGEVAWQLGECFGVSFHSAISDAVVEEYTVEDWHVAPVTTRPLRDASEK
ncbi:PilZ domain-containing protein [Qipengyuania soli]|uniref:PilZ domain-containing protein n=1 Tax=Qipengyuania soli TaxID=2782568 RepID=A0A7S8ISN5_9SPHN|nr:PilZ domain-containing protein [Qipengyuania soli]QPC98943.1 PilZ domain-containing protein [Qipengyuania soli]